MNKQQLASRIWAAAKEGSQIALIEGNELVRLVKKYELYIKPVQTYVLDDFYDSND